MSSPLSRSPLYRKPVAAVILLALIAAAVALAQEDRHHAHQLRAVALVELYGPASKPTGGRLLPVFVLDRDKYYDASTYDATPRPLALDPGTVYEAVNGYGESAGFFTVGLAKQQKGDWFGLGQWKSAAQVKAAELAAAKRREAEHGHDEGPPMLHKSGSSGSSTASSSGASGRPQLKKPTESSKPEESKPTTTASEAPPASTSSDPDRPVLRRGAGEQVKAMLEEPPAQPVPTAGRPALKPRPGGPSQVFLAVSDPDGTGTLHPLAFPWKPDEEKAIRAKSIAIAETELNNYLQARRGAPVKGKKAPPLVHLMNPMVVSYDLNDDNNAEFVISGEASGVYVLVVTRTDLNFEPQKIFSAVTDKDHLDAFPKLELIGPVDADGKGKAELLFRATYDDGYRYRLYKTGREEMWQLWESGLYPE